MTEQDNIIENVVKGFSQEIANLNNRMKEFEQVLQDVYGTKALNDLSTQERSQIALNKMTKGDDSN